MNEQLKKLAEESGMEWDTHSWCWLANPPHLERFAEMVRADERQGCAEDYLKIMRDAVEAARQDEREICAALCLAPIQYGRVENNSATVVGGGKFSRQKTYTECYKAIKERGLK
jgi:hypothetical protein